MGDMPPILTAAAIIVVCFVALWPISLARRDASIVDFLWGPGFAIQAWIVLALADSVSPIGYVMLALVTLWSARLSTVMIARRLREGHEDPRYTSVRRSWGDAFWWKSLFIVFVLQSVLQIAVAQGALWTLTSPAEINLLTIVGLGLALTGIALESVADWQLDAFKRDAHEHALLDSGFRAHVRHPNYTGEILFWVGVALVGLSVGVWVGLLSAALITGLLAFLSGIPMLDERMEETRPGWTTYRETTPALLPRLRRRPTLSPGE